MHTPKGNLQLKLQPMDLNLLLQGQQLTRSLTFAQPCDILEFPSETRAIPLLTPLIDPNWINSELAIALVPTQNFQLPHLHHHYFHNFWYDTLGNVLHRDAHCTLHTFGRHC